MREEPKKVGPEPRLFSADRETETKPKLNQNIPPILFAIFCYQSLRCK
jgi:hypothetical protein